MRRWSVVGAAALLCIVPLAHAERKRMLGEGDGVFRPAAVGALTRLPLAGPLTAAERASLGLPPEGPFTLEQIKADLLVVEVLNASCYACTLMAPVMEEVYLRVAADEGLRGKVKFIGIGVGNTLDQVRRFRELYETPFPLLPDPDFAAYDALATSEGTPYLILRTSGLPGAGEARYHVGLIPRAERVVEEIASTLAGVPPAGAAAAVAAGGTRLAPPLTDAELRERLRAAAAEAGLADATVTPVRLGEETYYRLAAAGKQLWASVAGRAKVCNVCHDVSFIILFGDDGKVVNFAPIAITKYKNVEFSPYDVEVMKQRVIGRYLTQEIVFDPAVDAVATATMSSALVFDTLRRLREAYRDLSGMEPPRR